ncbi:MAG: PLP-dependent transferase, partial [Rickettsiales bacterium]
VLVADTVYDPCRKYCDAELKRLGVAVTYYDPMAGDEIGSLFQPNTKAIYLESPGSMTFEVQDTRKLAEIAHQHGALVLADCTWATPLAPSPFSLGIDVNIQALTKYACGHADVLMGAITVKGKLAKQLETQYKHYGMNVSPDDCYLMLRGLRTLAVRVEQQEQTGLKLAEWFKARPETRRVLHPAFESCPGHAHWKRDIGRSCGLFSVIIDPYDKKALAAMFDGFKIFGMGFSWGGFESLLIALDPKSIRTAKPWVEEGVLLRIHAGLEAPEDLIAELEEGFKRLNAAA